MTLQTIADRLGVSRTTASNAWSRPDQLSDELRAEVLRVAAELGYAGPHPAARSLRSGQAGAIGLVLTEQLGYAFADPYALRFLRGVTASIETADAGLLLMPLPPGHGLGRAVERAVIDGAIVYSMPDDHPVIDLLQQRGIPFVCVDQPRPAGVPWVGIDDRAAAAEMASLVLAAGHRRILVLSFRVAEDEHDGVVDAARLQRSTFHVTAERVGGALESLRADPGVTVEIREVRLNQREHAEAQVRQALTGPDAPTAVIATSDELAIGALDAAAGLGLAVPTDVSVVGFDDVDAAHSLGLTTVRQPAEEKGQRAADLLLAGAADLAGALPHEIVERTSLGPAPDRQQSAG